MENEETAIGSLAQRADFLPGEALSALARVMGEHSSTHGKELWKSVSQKEHFNRSLLHAFAFMEGRTDEDHFEHFVMRAVLALAQKERVKPNGKVDVGVNINEHFSP